MWYLPDSCLTGWECPSPTEERAYIYSIQMVCSLKFSSKRVNIISYHLDERKGLIHLLPFVTDDIIKSFIKSRVNGSIVDTSNIRLLNLKTSALVQCLSQLYRQSSMNLSWKNVFIPMRPKEKGLNESTLIINRTLSYQWKGFQDTSINHFFVCFN